MRTCLRPRLRCQEKLWFPLQSLGTAPQNCFFVNENGINPSLCIVAPGQHLVFCYLLNLQKSFCKKKGYLRNVKTWFLKCTVLIFPAALHDLIPQSLNCWKLDRNANPKIPTKSSQ